MTAIVPCARTDVTPTRDGAYHDVDVSGLAPAGAIAVILEVWNTDEDYRSFAIRKKGSTDDFYHDIYSNLFKKPTRTAFIVGLDENRIFEAKIEAPVDSEGVTIIMYAYIPEGVGTFFDNGIDVTPGTGLQTIDITAHTGSDIASAGIFILVNEYEFGSYTWLVRPYGNNFAGASTLFNYCQTGVFMGCDENERFQSNLNNANLKLYLIGYLNEGYWENVNPCITQSISEINVWEDWELIDVPLGTLWALVIERDISSNRFQYGIRKNGSAVDNFAFSCIGIYTVVELDARTIEIKSDDKDTSRWFLIGYEALAGASGMGEII